MHLFIALKSWTAPTLCRTFPGDYGRIPDSFFNPEKKHRYAFPVLFFVRLCECLFLSSLRRSRFPHCLQPKTISPFRDISTPSFYPVIEFIPLPAWIANTCIIFGVNLNPTLAHNNFDRKYPGRLTGSFLGSEPLPDRVNNSSRLSIMYYLKVNKQLWMCSSKNEPWATLNSAYNNDLGLKGFAARPQ